MVPFVLIANALSDINDFTREFLQEIRDDLDNADSLQDLNDVRDKLWNEAVDETKMIRLSYALDIKKIMQEIDNKIEILTKLNLSK